MNEVLTGLAHANLGAGAAILAVLALRKPVRLAFGARAAYGLWIAAPLAALATFLPALPAAPRLSLPAVADGSVGMAVSWAEQAPAPSGVDPVFALWAAGAVLSLALLAWRQHRFVRLAAKGLAGPAVIGFLFPRIVAPADFETRFGEEERRVILAHERAHLTRQDARVAGLIAFAQCACWFNPLVHLAAFYARLDQELACDAEVMARHPNARRTYAEAMLKTQLAPAPLPLGCYWPPRGAHPLEARIAMLNRPLPTAGRRIAGAGLAALLTLTVGYAAWAAVAAPAATVMGQTNAKVTVIEYASTTCSHCARWNAEVFPAFKAKYVDTGLVRYELREFPTAPREAAAAGFLVARCAAPARYFEVIDSLFRSQGEADARGALIKAGRAGGLTEEKALSCAADKDALAGLNERVKAAQADGIEATPTFVIGERRIVGAQPLAAFDAVLQPMLAKQTASPTGSGLAMRLVQEESVAGAQRVVIEGRNAWLAQEVAVTGAMVAEAQASADSAGRPVVSVSLTPEGGLRFAALTRENVGRRIAILVGDEVVMAPVVREAMTDGRLQISGDFTTATARELAAKIAR